MSWSTSELRVRLAPLNRFKPSSKIFYWPFQGGTSFVDLLCFCSVLCLLCFVRVCLYVLRGHLLGKGWPLGSRLWCLLWVCHFPIGILGQVWYLIVSIPDLCNLTYFSSGFSLFVFIFNFYSNSSNMKETRSMSKIRRLSEFTWLYPTLTRSQNTVCITQVCGTASFNRGWSHSALYIIRAECAMFFFHYDLIWWLILVLFM